MDEGPRGGCRSSGARLETWSPRAGHAILTASDTPMLIAQLSDLHVSTAGSRNDTSLRTTHYLRAAVEHLNALPQQPDCVLLTGDLVEAGDPAEYAVLRELVDALKAPAFVIPGNHDEREALRTAFADHAYVPRSGFFQYVVDTWPVRLIGLDTVVPLKSGGLLCAERLAWLDARLREAPSKPTLIFLHHPPFDTGIGVMDDMGLENRDAFAAVVAKYPCVERVVCGHVHRAITTRFANTVAFACPGTAHQVALSLPPHRVLATVMEPPAAALHCWLGPAQGLVTHLSPIGARPLHLLFDGTKWLPEREPPADFHGRR